MSTRFPWPDCNLPLNEPDHVAGRSRGFALPRWRFLSPSSLLFCLVLFPLPWVELRCNSPPRSEVFATQSGFQSIYGGIRFYGNNPGAEDQWAEEVAREEKAGKRPKRGLFDRCAPYMALFLLAVLGGVLVGFLLRAHRARQAAVCGLTALAIILLSLQVGIGFPLERITLEKPIWRAALKQGGWPKDGNPMWGGFEWRYTPWLALTFVLLAVALGVVAAEWYTTGGWAAVRSRLRRNQLSRAGAALYEYIWNRPTASNASR